MNSVQGGIGRDAHAGDPAPDDAGFGRGGRFRLRGLGHGGAVCVVCSSQFTVHSSRSGCTDVRRFAQFGRDSGRCPPGGGCRVRAGGTRSSVALSCRPSRSTTLRPACSRRREIELSVPTCVVGVTASSAPACHMRRLDTILHVDAEPAVTRRRDVNQDAAEVPQLRLRRPVQFVLRGRRADQGFVRRAGWRMSMPRAWPSTFGRAAADRCAKRTARLCEQA